MPDSIDEQLVKHLTDVHSIEEQALRQMLSAPSIAGEPELARVFSDHHAETEEQRRRVRERLEAREAEPSKVKDLIARAGGAGMVLFARHQPDSPGKLTAHAFAYEHMEIAAYDLLALVAERAGDPETASVARAIREEESAMADRLAANFDRAAEASLDEVPSEELEDHLTDYLADAHAIEAQAIQLLQSSPKLAGVPELARLFEEHLEQSREQQSLVAARLDAHDAGPSRLKDAVLRVGGLNLGGFFAAQPDTPAKLAGFAFAFEHLETAAYELLKRVADRADDDETVAAAERIMAEEQAAAAAIRDQFEAAVDASLEAQNVAP
jgi:ferritin-like metal-binding protein YciE